MSDTRELSISRYIDAPPEKVWDVMVNRQEEWWCPTPWRAEIDYVERRPGGRCEMTFHGPDGEKMPQNGIYLAYDEGRRFITTDAVVGDFEPEGPFMIGIWEIALEGDGTRYTARARHWTDEARKQHEEMGFEPGWGACADQLKALCEAG
ncbi:SRPBCC family protein [Pelagerythrobacter rhizovicinus]|uniref:ATPase n=1 Tax=Pelagerythrobacter rhizovicinus TaxID=2268576 RepID=A0A4Q2KN74_9SPHN|nr:SRPBCC family protein [Pelagerythrobacter rhizovicinus]RXZ65877.1 ATPase [Pelagerythrobacter rhizovicinus]